MLLCVNHVGIILEGCKEKQKIKKKKNIYTSNELHYHQIEHLSTWFLMPSLKWQYLGGRGFTYPLPSLLSFKRK